LGNDVKAKAMRLEGEVWETVDLDSAIAAYARYVDVFPNSDSTLAVRFRRAELLERVRNWELARAEYRGLANSSATDELAFRSLERIVTHHLEAGEKEMARIEAKRALEAMDHLLTTVQDDATLLRIRELRARLLLDIGSWEQAYDALEELWTHYGHLTLGVQAGFRAAGLAERELKDPARARQLYQKLATQSRDPIDQETARRELERMRHERS
jgi:tetratricopeptide (TPR) repeat protein